MSEIGHAFSQPGVSCLDGRLGKHKGRSGGRGGQLGSLAPWPGLPRRGGWQWQPQGAFSGGDWQFRTHGEPPGGQESKNSLMCLFGSVPFNFLNFVSLMTWINDALFSLYSMSIEQLAYIDKIQEDSLKWSKITGPEILVAFWYVASLSLPAPPLHMH